MAKNIAPIRITLSDDAKKIFNGNAAPLKKCEQFVSYFYIWLLSRYFTQLPLSHYEIKTIDDLARVIHDGFMNERPEEWINNKLEQILYEMDVCYNGLLKVGDIAHIKSDRMALFALSFIANYLYGDPIRLVQHHDPKTLVSIVNAALIVKLGSCPYQPSNGVSEWLTYGSLDRKNIAGCSNPIEFNETKRQWLGGTYLWWQKQKIKEYKWLPLENNNNDEARDIWDALKNIHFSHRPSLFLKEPPVINIGSNISGGTALIDALTIACGDRYQFAVYTYLALISSDLERKSIKDTLARLVSSRKNKAKNKVKKTGRP